MKTQGEKLVPKYTVIRTKCDHCGRVEEGDPDSWASISYGHSDWGNDSSESWDEKDACSARCFIALLRQIADEYGVHDAPTLSVHIYGPLDYEMTEALGSYVEAEGK